MIELNEINVMLGGQSVKVPQGSQAFYEAMNDHTDLVFKKAKFDQYMERFAARRG